MNKIIAMLGTSALTLGVMLHGAEARKVSYEINGQRYTYETNDPEQVVAARQRIEAANAADAAKAKANAERAGNPLVGIFGSQAQREAEAAKARLDQLIAEQEKAAAERRQQARAERRKKVAEQAEEERDQASAEQTAQTEPGRTRTARAPEPSLKPAPAVPVSTPHEAARTLGIKSVSYDMESGIKTTFMVDGTIHEEPFDTGILEKLVSAQGQTGSLTAFIDQLRSKAAPEEATGSIMPRTAGSQAQAQ